MSVILTTDQIARVCHEAVRAYAMSLGDHSLGTWDMAAPWQKETTIKGVEAILADPKMTAEGSHEKWLEMKKAAGWKLGPEKRPETLEHPCMVSFDELPPAQQAKDALFVAIVRSMEPFAPAAPKPKPTKSTEEKPKGKTSKKKTSKKVAKKGDS